MTRWHFFGLPLAVAALLTATAAWAAAQPAAKDELLFMSNRSNNVFEFYRMAADGSRVHRVLPERGAVEGMNWSPDGTRVVYSAARKGGHQNIFVTSVVDGATQQLTTDTLPAGEPAWAPDGRTIAFVSMRDGSRKIYLMDADGGRQRRLTDSVSDDEISPRFSPDGAKVAFLASNERTATRVNVADLATGRSRLLSADPQRRMETPPVWSPDGKRLLFSSLMGQNSHLMSIAVDGSDSQQLTRGVSRNAEAQWSPDGGRILFLSVPATSARSHLHVMNADGSQARQLRGGVDDVMGARWSSDGQRIFFVEHLATGGQIYSIDVGGQDVRKLSRNEGFDVNIEVCCSLTPAKLAGVQ